MSEPFEGNSKLIIGNGTGLCITHIGNVVLRMHNSFESITLKLNNMLLILFHKYLRILLAYRS